MGWMNLSMKQKGTHRENRSVVAKGKAGLGRDGLGVWGWQMQTITQRMDKQQGPAAEHWEVYSIPCDKP